MNFTPILLLKKTLRKNLKPLAGLLIFLLPFQSYSATITVCASGCDHTTIQAAISAATSGDIIKVTDAIHLEFGIDINVDGLIIEGVSQSGTIVEAASTAGTATGRIFHLNASINTTIRKMTLRHGNTLMRGGAILVGDMSTLTLEEVTLTENHAHDAGGAIGTVSSTSGSSITLTDCEVSNNTAQHPMYQDGYGGGIYNSGGDLTMTDCIISGNISDEEGGGIYIEEEDSQNDFIRCTIINNTALITSGTSYGGGISINDGHLYMEDCTIEGNKATDGGGLSLYDFALIHYFGLINCVIINNEADITDTDADGGGIIISDGLLYMENCSVVRNSAGDDGGGIGFISDFGPFHSIINTTISSNTSGIAGENVVDPRRGGGLDIHGFDDVSLIHCTIASNNTLTTLGFGGGIAVDEFAFLGMVNTIIADNEAASGADLYLEDPASIFGDDYNLVENCDVGIGVCPTFFISIDPNLGGLSTCSGGAYKHTLFAGSSADDVGLSDPFFPTEDICGDTRNATTPDLGSVESITCTSTSHVGDIYFRSQADLDNFDPCITTVTGQILIIGEDITDVSNLKRLSTVTKSVVIRETNLKNLNGLENLQTTNNFLLVNNPSMMTLDGLSGLTDAFNIVISNNPQLDEYGDAAGIAANGGTFRVLGTPLP